MHLIKSLSEFLNLLENNPENIFFGAGYISKCGLRYLKKKKKKSLILCIAVSNMAENNDSLDGVPIIPIHNMGCFSENSILIIMTKSNLYEEITELVTSYGFKNIYALTDGCQEEMIDVCFGYNDISLEDIMREIQYLRIASAEQNEVTETNSQAFRKYMNCNIGRRVVIVGTGPTLKYYKPMENVIHIGMNGAWRRSDIQWDYYFAQDFDRRTVEHRDFIENVSCQFFLGRYSQNNQGAKYCEAPVSYGLIRDNISHYFLDKCPSREIYLDIAQHPLFCNGSVVFPALHFALYTNPEKIYLVGCDTTPKGYSYLTNEKKIYDNAVSIWRVGYARMKTFAEYYYPDTEIISINPVGLKGLFKDVDMK